MMHRKKHAGAGRGPVSPLFDDGSINNDSADDGGSAKRKGRRIGTGQTLSNLSKNVCFPEVPVALKLVICSFVAFAILMVLTAKVRRTHFHYRHNSGGSNNEAVPGGGGGGGQIRGVPSMPVPLTDRLKQGLHLQSSKNDNNNNENSKAYNDGGDNSASSSIAASQRMLAQPSRFVDAEKKLKQQLLKLLEKQNDEKKKNRGKETDSNNSVLGVKISNRYLGEDLLPYPESKQLEGEWELRMNKRKDELRKEDETEWKSLMNQYKDIMVDYLEENEHADHNMVGAPESLGDNENQQQQLQQQPELKAVNSVPSSDNATWPPPTQKAGDDSTIILKPAFGTHRPSSNAILVFAEGYDLSIYLSFVESLVSTGYSGDVVFSISNESKLKPGVKDYLKSKSAESGEGVNIVAYEVDWTCFKKTGEAAHGTGEGANDCKMNNVFGDAVGNPVDDPREPRPVATARYELYWIWSLQYLKESWIMLLDVRDVWFQLDPFEQVGSKGKVTGELHLFGENADAVRLGTSAYNKRWLLTAYGKEHVSPYFNEPVICSGSTMGNQNAIETYLRAMVAQFDVTNCKSKGCDQGFHNYLYYSGQLGKVDGDTRVDGISKLFVHEQGKGIINNLGALRTKPLEEWGMYNKEKELVLNWDGSTSPVAHQYDRDKEVNKMVKGRKKLFEEQWRFGKQG